MFFKLLICFFIITLVQTVFCQQMIQAPPIFNSDYQAFRLGPEYDKYPEVASIWPKNLNGGIDLSFLELDKFAVGRQFSIDTMYYKNSITSKEKFKNYRRIFSYDEQSRISSVIAQEHLDNQWIMHQQTEIIYDKQDKIVEIYNFRNDPPFNQLKITYVYDGNDFVEKEIGEIKENNGNEWSLAWEKSYLIEKGNVIYFDLLNYEDYNWERSNRGEYFYDDDKLIEVVEYKLKDNSLIRDYRRVFEYNDDNQLKLYNFYNWEKSSWFLVSSNNYEYDERGNFVKIKNKADYSRDSDTSYYEKEIVYDDQDRITEILFYSRTSSDSLSDPLYKSGRRYKYNIDGYLISHVGQIWDDKGILKNGSRVTIERDEFQNVTNIISEKWFRENWLEEDRMRITYKTK